MIMVVVQFGGIGIMSNGTFFWLILKKRIGMRERQLIMVDHNQYSIAGVVYLIREIVTLIFMIELVGGLIFTIYIMKYYDTLGEAFLHGLFMSVSATTNTGFDLTGESLAPYFNDYFIPTITMILIVLGAIGFPVLIEVKSYLTRRRKNFRFSLFTKITTATFGIPSCLWCCVYFYFGIPSCITKGLAWHEKIFTALFHSVSSRSAGLTTFDITQFSDSTNIFISSFDVHRCITEFCRWRHSDDEHLAIAILFLINFAKRKMK